MTSYPQLDLSAVQGPTAVIKTTVGEITVKLFPEQAPKAVENFVTHARDGYYDGVIFHRVIKDFMLQTGDPEGTGMGGQSIWNKPFEDEFSSELFNFRGALSMANAGPNTNGSQFFIVQAKSVPGQMASMMKHLPDEIVEHYREVGGTPWLDGKHTVFGQVVTGMDVVDKIASSKTDMYDRPNPDVTIEKIEIAG
ncbi:peptidylprolyl isomerase [Eupransor demetentiae]|uniref:Peptidyl-prolyl cis-trans isomerase n=1 Tax=Eupransor demetentiae TaxID=3109584 RepID=A0ABM9N620_9LACO|nr:Peptidyl-prolyl cis-trans isomerase (rotamase) -cyclophilin family (PpiB) [Lactobacillaceae bacterium LMG 33000]